MKTVSAATVSVVGMIATEAVLVVVAEVDLTIDAVAVAMMSDEEAGAASGAAMIVVEASTETSFQEALVVPWTTCHVDHAVRTTQVAAVQVAS